MGAAALSVLATFVAALIAAGSKKLVSHTVELPPPIVDGEEKLKKLLEGPPVEAVLVGDARGSVVGEVAEKLKKLDVGDDGSEKLKPVDDPVSDGSEKLKGSDDIPVSEGSSNEKAQGSPPMAGSMKL